MRAAITAGGKEIACGIGGERNERAMTVISRETDKPATLM